MRAHVRGDAARLREPAVAHRAPERLLPGVGPAVRRQVGGLKHSVHLCIDVDISGISPSGLILLHVQIRLRDPRSDRAPATFSNEFT